MTTRGTQEEFYESKILDAVRQKLMPQSLTTPKVTQITESVKNLKLSSKIVIEKFTSREDNVEDWFESFDINVDVVDWSDEVKGIPLPAYLEGLALIILKNQSPTEKTNYQKNKTKIVSEMTGEDTIEQLRKKTKRKRISIGVPLQNRRIGKQNFHKLKF